MILLDAYALIAHLADELAAEETSALLRGGDCAMATVNLSEAVDRLQRVHGIVPDQARVAMAPLLDGPIAVLGVSLAVAWRAGDLRAEHYRVRVGEISLADCILLATAGEEDQIATADPVLAATARAEGTKVIPLPDTRGRRP